MHARHAPRRRRMRASRRLFAPASLASASLARATFVLAALAILAPARAWGQPEPAPFWRGGEGGDVVAGDLGKQLDDAVRRATYGQFWGCVLAAKDGEIVLAKGYALANDELEPITGDTLLELASVSKAFTAAAILRLEMQGKLTLDDPIAMHLASVPDDKRGVTIRHLLTHTSGIPQPEGGFDADERERVVPVLLGPRMKSPPGAAFAYSNAGYWLLAAIVERVSGRSFEEFVRDEVFRPAGMGSTFAQTDPTLDLSRCAVRVSRGRTVGNAGQCPYPFAWGYRGSGGVVTSARDMFAWDRALRGGEFLADAQRTAMFTPALGNYALGWTISTGPLGRVASHTGGVAGFRVVFTRWLDTDACVLVITNEQHDPSAISAVVTGLLLPGASESSRVVLRVGGMAANEHGRVRAPDDTEGRVRTPDAGAPALEFGPPGAPPVVTIALPREAMMKAADSLVRFGSGARAGEHASPRVILEVYTRAYQGMGDTIELADAGLTVTVSPGSPHREPDALRRVTMIVQDPARSFWPVFVKMDAHDARALGERLRAALGAR
ncbi:MAG: serine hydrolase domain-containing protein [Planctomycetota bacterium]|nr:serine hydrolase domain-containing protein [Planctomycetota bacterium]